VWWASFNASIIKLVAMFAPPHSLNGSTGTLEGLGAALNGDGAVGLGVKDGVEITGMTG
jgi:hypothetical protein